MSFFKNLNMAPQNSVSNSSVAQTSFKFYSSNTVSLTNQIVAQQQYTIRAPNSFPMSNLNFQLTVTDTTGSTAPSGVNSIENTIQSLQIYDKNNTLLASINGVYGEFQRWQRILNPRGVYQVAPTPSDSEANTSYTATYNFNFGGWIVDNSAFPISVVANFNTLSSRASTLNGMTSTAQLNLTGDFVPIQGYVKTLLRTKQVSQSSTGIASLGLQLDNAVINAISVDVGADSNLSQNNSIFLAVNNNTLIPNAPYQQVINNEVLQFGSSYSHINGFFPLHTIYGAPIDGRQNVAFNLNIASNPNGGGLSNTINLYMLEQY